MRAKINSGGGLLINMEGYDTFFQLISGSKQIVVPNNKRMVSKIYAFFLDNDAQTNRYKDTFRSCIQGSGVAGVGIGRPRDENIMMYEAEQNGQNGATQTSDPKTTKRWQYWDAHPGLLSY